MKDLQEQLNTQKRKVDFDTYDITVKEIISMVADKVIDIAPDYQRLFQWRDDRQSKFIESVLRPNQRSFPCHPLERNLNRPYK